jgi:hypothetical protein
MQPSDKSSQKSVRRVAKLGKKGASTETDLLGREHPLPSTPVMDLTGGLSEKQAIGSILCGRRANTSPVLPIVPVLMNQDESLPQLSFCWYQEDMFGYVEQLRIFGCLCYNPH